MIKAKEAHKLTDKIVRNNTSKRELKEIKYKINDAIKNGSYSVTSEGHISKDTLLKLIGLGYEAENKIQSNGCYYHCIKW